jgi:RND family efflux transporter MFP subunit
MRPVFVALALSITSLLPIAIVRIAGFEMDEAEAVPPPRRAIEHRAKEVEASASDPFVGVVRAGEAVDVAPKFEGKLKTLLHRTGDRVTKGSILARIDTRALDEDLVMARANLSEAEARAHEAAQRLRRRRSLSKWAGVSREELDEARAHVKVMDAQVTAQRARVAQLQHNLEDADLKAPFDAVVALAYASPGALVGPAKPVLRLLSEGEIEVRFAVPENRAHEVAVGAPVRVAFEREDFTARASVISVAPEIDSGSHMIYALARLDAGTPERERLASGTVVRVSVASGSVPPKR